MSDPSLVYVDMYETPAPATWADILHTRPRPQRWRWRALNGRNFRVLAVSSEAYTNEGDCRAAITQLFGTGSEVFLRRHERGNELLRLATLDDD